MRRDSPAVPLKRRSRENGQLSVAKRRDARVVGVESSYFSSSRRNSSAAFESHEKSREATFTIRAKCDTQRVPPRVSRVHSSRYTPATLVRRISVCAPLPFFLRNVDLLLPRHLPLTQLTSLRYAAV